MVALFSPLDFLQKNREVTLRQLLSALGWLCGTYLEVVLLKQNGPKQRLVLRNLPPIQESRRHFPGHPYLQRRGHAFPSDRSVCDD
jgi:hypothetical protein